MTNGGSKLSSTEVNFGDVMGVYSVNFSCNQQYLVAGCGNGAIQVNYLAPDICHIKLFGMDRCK